MSYSCTQIYTIDRPGDKGLITFVNLFKNKAIQIKACSFYTNIIVFCCSSWDGCEASYTKDYDSTQYKRYVASQMLHEWVNQMQLLTWVNARGIAYL